MNSSENPTTVYHLQMLDPQNFKPKAAPAGFSVSMLSEPDVQQNRWLYEKVGGDYQWIDRLRWTEQQWQDFIFRDELQTWIGEFNDQTVGYFELEKQDAGSVEIAYFGLLPEFIGQGLGGPLLSATIEQAWNIPETKRVWVHTCTKDHEHALENYRKRGFEIFKTELD